MGFTLLDFPIFWSSAGANFAKEKLIDYNTGGRSLRAASSNSFQQSFDTTNNRHERSPNGGH
jgi:hypothetical protein